MVPRDAVLNIKRRRWQSFAREERALLQHDLRSQCHPSNRGPLGRAERTYATAILVNEDPVADEDIACRKSAKHSENIGASIRQEHVIGIYVADDIPRGEGKSLIQTIRWPLIVFKDEVINEVVRLKDVPRSVTAPGVNDYVLDRGAFPVKTNAIQKSRQPRRLIITDSNDGEVH
jgi:hypothetical protein